MIPYTYLIGWSHLNSFYYGIRFSKKCHPDDLWTKYFTYSKYVRAFREQHGDPDVIEVRKCFQDKKSAINWEFKVLRRMNVIKDKRFLNCGIQGKFFCSKDTLSDEHKKRIGESWTDDRKISSSEDWKTNNPMFKDDVKMKVGMATRKRRLGAKTTEETRTKISESLKGRCLSKSHKKAISESKKGDKNPMYGKKISKEVIENRIEKI